MPSIYVVLLNWRDYFDTKECVESLLTSNYLNLTVVVVDNNSQDNSPILLKSDFPHIKIIENKTNLGFSGGCNVGIKYSLLSGADFILLLNNDCIVEPNFLDSVTDTFFTNSKVGAITGKILYNHKKNTIWQAGGHINLFKAQGVPRGLGEIDNGQFDNICETGWASGAMSLFPRTTFLKVGMLPEEYFFGNEEWDFSTAILKNDLKIIYDPQFKSYHKAGGSYKAGHPILNIYGGCLNKMIYAQKYMHPTMFFLWKRMYWFYLTFMWNSLAKEGCNCIEDYLARKKAAKLAFHDHKNIKKVTLEVLHNAANKIGSTPTWNIDWAS